MEDEFAAAEAVHRAVEFAAPLSATEGVCLVLAVAGIALAYGLEGGTASARRRASLATLRILAVGCLAWLRVDPQVVERRVARPWIAVLADASQSMFAVDGQGASRLATSQEALAAGESPLLAQLARRYRVRWQVFGRQASRPQWVEAQRLGSLPTALREASAAVDAAATRLGDVAAEVLDASAAESLPAAVVLVTDGLTTDGQPLESAAARARQLGVPLFGLTAGSDAPPVAATLELSAERAVYPGDRLPVDAFVRGEAGASGPALLSVVDAATGSVLAQQSCDIPPAGEELAVRLWVVLETPGPHRLEGRLASAQQPAGWRDAVAEARVEVSDERLGVLLAAGTPSFEYRALKSLLERDDALEVRAWLQDADPDFPQTDPAAVAHLPATDAEFDRYAVVVLGAVPWSRAAAGTLDALGRWVDQGGGLAVFAGSDFPSTATSSAAPLPTLLPIAWPAFPPSDAQRSSAEFRRMAPTAAGRSAGFLQLLPDPQANAQLWDQLPPLDGIAVGAEAKRGAEVLAAAALSGPPAEPLLVRHYYGRGEVVVQLTDSTWRWRWRNDDRYFARYWGQLVRRLARGRLTRGGLAVAAGRPRYAVGDAVELRLRDVQRRLAQRGEEAAVRLTGDASPPRRIVLRRSGETAESYVADVFDLPPDNYAAQLIGEPECAAALFVVEEGPRETARRPADFAALRRAAAATGGACWPVDAAGELLDRLPAPRATTVVESPARPLASPHGVIAALGALLGIEWYGRRRGAMW